MYVTDQNSFLNAVVKIDTTLKPHDLLSSLKDIEKNVGRTPSIRNGPRQLDLDILLYLSGSSSLKLNETNPDPSSPLPLEIPHPRIEEREFVLRPLADLFPSYALPLLKELNSDEAVRVIPLGGNRTLKMDRTRVMGILNVTPDSFSDGGEYDDVELAVEQAKKMVDLGADIIDVGGESTRPGAPSVPLSTEINRIESVIKSVRLALPTTPISIDTRNSETAKIAVNAGADIVNDVSGGSYDPKMMSVVGSMKVPYCIMHSRGTPETMQSLTTYDNLIEDVVEELKVKGEEAKRNGIYRWSLIYDVGIGFAKGFEQNLEVIKEGKRIGEKLGNPTLLWGASRKGFLRTILGDDVPPKDRDYGTVAAHQYAIQNAEVGQILRVHNVEGTKHASMVMDAIKRVKSSSPPPSTPPKESRGTDPSAKKPTEICDPYGQNGLPLSPQTVSPLLNTLHPSWSLSTCGLKLTRIFECEDWNAAVELSKTMGNVAFNNNHFPKITIKRVLGRSKWKDVVEVEMFTEVLGGLSYRDFEIATYIDVEVERK
ncbi:hypothetical protein TrVE_jg3176 [Triparma verrucosa]|uniref:Pterin-binding domain-containing protein n=1 Tax=Triparma verrucosa TaxID=1606542 RepID=A0A9W7C194_9STRA|nr:hypothetical protein TrVE_jg3176 [Triparma verrucosa]